MKIAPFSIADYSEATEGMPHDVERLYFRILLKMYSREGGLPDDDRENARIFGYDVRIYRRLKAALLQWPDAIYIENGEIMNTRAEKDITEATARRKRAAENGKVGGRSNELRPDFDEKSNHISHIINSENNKLAEASPSPSPLREENTTPISPHGGGRQPGATRRGTRLADDWVLPGEWRAWTTANYTATDSAIDDLAAEFADYWRGVPGQRGTKLDWFATWRNRVRDRWQRWKRPEPRSGEATVARQPSSTVVDLQQIYAEMNAEEAARQAAAEERLLGSVKEIQSWGGGQQRAAGDAADRS